MRFDLAAGVPRPLQRLFHGFQLEVDGEDFGTFLSEPDAGRPAVPPARTDAARASDDCDFSV